MFKSSAENQQRRERIAALFDRRNFTRDDYVKHANDLLAEKGALSSEKEEIQARLRKIKDELHKSYISRGYSRSKTNVNLVANREKERSALIARVAVIERGIAEIKRVIRESSTAPWDRMTYSDAFYRVAKDTLPEEILRRLNAGAVALCAHYNGGQEAGEAE